MGPSLLHHGLSTTAKERTQTKSHVNVKLAGSRFLDTVLLFVWADRDPSSLPSVTCTSHVSVTSVVVVSRSTALSSERPLPRPVHDVPLRNFVEGSFPTFTPVLNKEGFGT